MSIIEEFDALYYANLMKGPGYLKGRYVNWRGIPIIKYPTDLFAYQEVIFENKPTVIIETGTAYGGSACFFGDMLQLMGGRRVISVDTQDRNPPAHPYVNYVIGGSTDEVTIQHVKDFLLPDDRVMVVLDSDHARRHVKRELWAFKEIVSPGQYIVVEDIYNRTYERGPGPAVDWFLKHTRKQFKREDVIQQGKYLIGVTKDGWLRRV